MEEEPRINYARIEIMTGDWISYRVFDGGDYGEWIKLDSYHDLEQTLRKILTEHDGNPVFYGFKASE
jgi:hypothetical protein